VKRYNSLDCCLFIFCTFSHWEGRPHWDALRPMFWDGSPECPIKTTEHHDLGRLTPRHGNYIWLKTNLAVKTALAKKQNKTKVSVCMSGCAWGWWKIGLINTPGIYVSQLCTTVTKYLRACLIGGKIDFGSVSVHGQLSPLLWVCGEAEHQGSRSLLGSKVAPLMEARSLDGAHVPSDPLPPIGSPC
jgi:hypothetical protein